MLTVGVYHALPWSVVHIPFLCVCVRLSTHRDYYIPLRGLSAVVRLDDLGNAKASKVGWAAGESHAFLFIEAELFSFHSFRNSGILSELFIG